MTRSEWKAAARARLGGGIFKDQWLMGVVFCLVVSAIVGAAGSILPVQIVRLVLLQHVVIALERFQLKFRVAIGTLHLLQRAVKGDSAAATGAFIFL